jgi:uncharacterized protein (DUF342 family)
MSDPGQHVQARVEISQDAMSASIRLPPTVGLEPPTIEALAGVARDRCVLITNDRLERLQQILASYLESPREINEVFAEGTPAEHGVPSRIDWAEGCDPFEHEPVGENQLVDHYNSGTYIQVNAEQVLGRIIPATEGVDGATVTGAVVRAKPGKRLGWDLDRGSIDVDDDTLRAKCDGVMLVAGKSVKVTNLIEVSSVDFSTGNVSSEGSVHVRSAVKDRFVIRATEDIVVDGLVEAATLSCGGNLVLRRGMAARDQGALDIRGDADVNYLNAVRATIHGSLVFRRELIGSDVSIGADLIGESGSILGGRTAITGSVRVASLGSEGESPTRLVLGAMPVLTNERERLAELNEQLEASIKKHQTELRPLEASKRSLGPVQKERLTELSFAVDEASQALSRNLDRMEEIDRLVKEGASVDVFVTRSIHPKVTLEVDGNEITFIKELRGPVRIGWNENRELVVRQGDGPPTTLAQYATVRKAAERARSPAPQRAA